MINNNSTGRLLDVFRVREANNAVRSWAQGEGNVLKKALTAHSVAVSESEVEMTSASWMYTFFVISTNQRLEQHFRVLNHFE
jgi:hypothetical protein